jgi:hypothetical protein
VAYRTQCAARAEECSTVLAGLVLPRACALGAEAEVVKSCRCRLRLSAEALALAAVAARQVRQLAAVLLDVCLMLDHPDARTMADETG